MKKEQLLISTTASDADAVARQYGLEIEIAECNARLDCVALHQLA